MSRQSVRGIMLVPEKFKLLNNNLTHIATRYKVYGDRARNVLLLDTILSGVKKDAFTYYDDSMYDDQILYFTTNMQLSDDSWTGESPLTRVVLRREQVSSTGIIVTPNVSIYKLGSPGGFNIIVSDFIRYEGTSAHESTTYRIEDEITGEVVFEKIDDMNNLLTIKTPDNILKPNRLYRISVRFKDIVGRYSNYGSMLYNYNNLLYSMFPNENITTMYGSRIIIENKIKDVLTNGLVSVEGSIDNNVVYNGYMVNNNISIDSKQFGVGDILNLKITMGESERFINVYISKQTLVSKYDSTFELANIFENVTLNLNTTIDNNGTTKQEFKDGYIYDYTISNQLVRYRYDDINKKLTDYSILNQYTINIANIYRRIIENPIDGNIIVLTVDVSNVNPHHIIIIDINTYDIINVIPVDSSVFSFIYSQQPLIINNMLYLINYYTTSTTKTVYSLDLSTYELSIIGVLSFDFIEPNLDGNVHCSGYNQIVYKNNIYLINNGGNNDLTYTSSKKVYKLNMNTLTIEFLGSLDIDVGIPAGYSSSIMTTLKNGKVALIYSKSNLTSNGNPIRDITGLYYIDLDTMKVDTTNMISGIAHTTIHGNNVLLNDGTFLFFNNTECVHFK